MKEAFICFDLLGRKAFYKAEVFQGSLTDDGLKSGEGA